MWAMLPLLYDRPDASWHQEILNPRPVPFAFRWDIITSFLISIFIQALDIATRFF